MGMKTYHFLFIFVEFNHYKLTNNTHEKIGIFYVIFIDSW